MLEFSIVTSMDHEELARALYVSGEQRRKAVSMPVCSMRTQTQTPRTMALLSQYPEGSVWENNHQRT